VVRGCYLVFEEGPALARFVSAELKQSLEIEEVRRMAAFSLNHPNRDCLIQRKLRFRDAAGGSF
jgi:hypothetical protein